MKFDRYLMQDKGDKILIKVRKLIEKAAHNNDDKFYFNRYVFQRLRWDEQKGKDKIKKKLFEKKPQCNFCGKSFASIKGIVLHRKDDTRGYDINNSVVTCEKCHRRVHTNEKSIEPNNKNVSSVRLKSITGEHKYIRQLVEELLDSNPNISYEEMEKNVLKEFPKSAFNKNHYAWYINKIIVNGEFKYV